MSELIYKFDGVLKNIQSKLNNNEHTRPFLKKIKNELLYYCIKNNIVKINNKKKIKKPIISNDNVNSLIDVLKVNEVIEKSKSPINQDMLIIFYLIKKIIKSSGLMS